MSHVKTNFNFKSKVSSIESAKDIQMLMEKAKISQKILIRITTPSELIRYWTINDLDNVNVNLEKIDRLYHISFDQSLKKFNLVARMIYENEKLLYINLNSNKNTYGTMFVSFDLTSFLDQIKMSESIKFEIINDAKEKNQKVINEDKKLNFISIVPEIKSVDSMLKLINQIFSVNKYKFERTSTPRELEKIWKLGQLEKIFIDMEKVDRLYSFMYNKSELELIFRMNTGFKQFYVKLYKKDNKEEMIISIYRHVFALNVPLSDKIQNVMLGETLHPFDDTVSFLKTHKNFKSFSSNASNALDIYSLVGLALHFQCKLEKQTSPEENEIWVLDELMNIEIIVEKIDCLFYINKYNMYNDTYYIILARMDYNNAPLYVELLANTNFKMIGGSILICQNFTNFIKNAETLKNIPLLQNMLENYENVMMI